MLLPVHPAKDVLVRPQRAWPMILQSKPAIVLRNSYREEQPGDRQGHDLGLKLKALQPDQQVVNVLSALKSLNSLCSV